MVYYYSHFNDEVHAYCTDQIRKAELTFMRKIDDIKAKDSTKC